MDARLRVINEHLKSYDADLFAERDSNGVTQIFRRKPVVQYYDYQGVRLGALLVQKQHILSLTEDWTLRGKPVEWGIEPLMRQITAMDSWRDDTGYARHCERRERYERDKERMRRNEWRARAADMRRDFAKATNDIIVQKQ